MPFFIALLMVFTIINANAGDSDLLSISLGPVELGEARIPVKVNDFEIIITGKKESIISKLVDNSVEWIRSSSNLLTPRARLLLAINDKSSRYFIVHNEKNILPLIVNGHPQFDLYVPLFTYAPITIKKGSEVIATVRVESKERLKKEKRQLIDYSCSKFNLSIQGVDDEFISVGCRLDSTGDFGSERPRLEVSLLASNLKMPDNSPPPFVAILIDSSPAKTTLVDNQGREREIEIKAELPKRMNRFKTALGFGPYEFISKQDGNSSGNNISPAAMIYSNFHLKGSASIRAFDALIYNGPMFNNFGFYFAYEIASVFDGRIDIVPLLGIQGLTFKHSNSKSKPYTKIIYPQGFEIAYKHAFGLINYTLVYGLFFSPTKDEQYKNIWLRFGKKIFAEFNYIDWRSDSRSATMWGLSLGIPFISLF